MRIDESLFRSSQLCKNHNKRFTYLPNRMRGQVNAGRKCCPLELNSMNLSFSLVDYRNSLYTSGIFGDIAEFYDSFKSREELIKWMSERPVGACHIHEVSGDKDIIVVITTPDFNGKFAKTCRQDIFKGLHMIFVESGELPDSYFNFAHNVNYGISKALEYEPKWIVYSNDDMYKIDDVEVLVEQLHGTDPDLIDVVFTEPSNYHSVPTCLGRLSRFGKLIRMASRRSGTEKYKSQLYDKLKIRFRQHSPFLAKILLNDVIKFTLTSDFMILSSRYAERALPVLDETYLNGIEDIDLSLRLRFCSHAKISYRIGDFIGSALGTDSIRNLRGLANYSYLNFKIDSGNLLYKPPNQAK